MTTPALHIDPHALIAFRDGREMPLTLAEWRMLRLLLATGCSTYEEWEIGYQSSRATMHRAAHRLRTRLDLALTLIHGVGYRLEAPR